MPRRQRPSRLDPARAVALVDEKLACFGPTANTAVLDAPTAQDGAAPQLREIRQVPLPQSVVSARGFLLRQSSIPILLSPSFRLGLHHTGIAGGGLKGDVAASAKVEPQINPMTGGQKSHSWELSASMKNCGALSKGTCSPALSLVSSVIGRTSAINLAAPVNPGSPGTLLAIDQPRASQPPAAKEAGRLAGHSRSGLARCYSCFLSEVLDDTDDAFHACHCSLCSTSTRIEDFALALGRGDGVPGRGRRRNIARLANDVVWCGRAHAANELRDKLPGRLSPVVAVHRGQIQRFMLIRTHRSPAVGRSFCLGAGLSRRQQIPLAGSKSRRDTTGLGIGDLGHHRREADGLVHV